MRIDQEVLKVVGKSTHLPPTDVFQSTRCDSMSDAITALTMQGFFQEEIIRGEWVLFGNEITGKKALVPIRSGVVSVDVYRDDG